MGFKPGIVNVAILTIVVIVVIFTAYAEIVPEAQEASGNMTDQGVCEAAGCLYNTSNTAVPHNCQVNSSDTGECTLDDESDYFPLQGLFAADGILFLVIMAGLVVLVVRGVMAKK